MSHIRAQHRAVATDHAVRRYAERVHYLTVDESLDDMAAVRELRSRDADRGAMRRRIASVGGVLLATGVREGNVVAHPEGVLFLIRGGAVVTILAKVMRANVKPVGPSMPIRKPTFIDVEPSLQ